ncbi:MAG TPA: ABC transporter ATP-binding protein [Thermodesulfobacteriota bacterium]|nr:ABC transporter ATP-binding protein [Thermodesulfobacteriota bacterium]
MPMLEVENIHTYYGQIHALKEVSLSVEKGEIVTLIGANGAGKSTLLKTISGLLRPRLGSIRFDAEDLTRYLAHEIVVKGIVQVPEGRHVFGQLTVMENLEMGAFSCKDPKLIRTNLQRTFTLFPKLKVRSKQVAGTLSGGEQQMLAIGRALMANPRLLLMDEPSMGLAPVLVDSIFETIQQLNTDGTTILLVEQNARMALQIANHGYVLQSGSVVLSDTAENLRVNEMVRKAYMGEM